MHCRKRAAACRKGSVLLIVLVVVALLALGAYTFAEFMIVEAEATSTYGRQVQARMAADSGVELAVSLLEKRYEPDPPTYYNNPEILSGVLLRNSTGPRGRARFMVMSANEQDTSSRTVRYGFLDESSKLNLNVLAQLVASNTLTAQQAETMLTGLSPDLTVEIADAILDWLDTDQNPMQNGAEIDYYQGLNPAFSAKDNQLDTLSELLLVRGVTPTLLFGEDTNHNGILDPNENDGAATPPLDNADGVLQRGWSQFLTVYSRENNLRKDGTPRININQSDMSALYNAVSSEFDVPTATFIIAYRMFGPSSSGGGNSGSGGSGGGGGNAGGGNAMASAGGGAGASGGGGGSGRSGAGGGTGGMASGGGSSGSSGGAGSGGASSGGGGGASGSAGGRSASAGSSGSQGSGGSSLPPAGQSIVAGINVTKGPTYTVKSLYELFGARTSGTVNATRTSLTSPLANTAAAIQENVAHIMEALTLTDTPYIDGRININLAPREILVGLPPLASNPSLVDSIVGAQIKNSSGQSSTPLPPDRQTTAWLVTTGLISVNQLEQLDPFITARGDVFHFQSIGYFDGGGPTARVEAVIDATQVPPQVVFMRDLTEFGRGFSSYPLPSSGGYSR